MTHLKENERVKNRVIRGSTIYTKEQVTLTIGEYYATSEKMILHTLLGSCVAVCLWDPEKQIGGMNHILMPGRPDLKQYNASARYGVNAMELLINGIMKLGGRREKMVAKTFGGANVIPSISEHRAIGRKIIRFVMDFLAAEKIQVAGQDLGGHHTRKIFFHTDTGEVYVKRVISLKSLNVIHKEKRRLKRIKTKLEQQGDITLF